MAGDKCLEGGKKNQSQEWRGSARESGKPIGRVREQTQRGQSRHPSSVVDVLQVAASLGLSLPLRGMGPLDPVARGMQ